MRWKQSPGSVLAALLAVHVLAHIDRNMLLGFSPQVTRDLALTNTQYGFLVGAVWVLSFGVMAVFMGTLADRFSRARVIAAGLLVWSVCTAASGAAQTFEQMVAARFFVACGEAALVPAAVSVLAEIFDHSRRGTAMGVFFTGIPLGIGLSFLLAGTFGAAHGWRGTFFALGVLGVAAALPLLFVRDERMTAHGDTERGARTSTQIHDVLHALRSNTPVQLTIVGFVLAHLVFAGFSFLQLWLVRERGFDAATIAKQVGGLQIVFGVLGSAAGGFFSDRIARRMPGGHAGFMAALVGVCAPLMIASRLVPAGSVPFYLGLCASCFLTLALYGPALALIQGAMPARMRSTVTGVTMMLINVFAIAIGNLLVGAASDRLAATGWPAPLTTILLATDVLVLVSAAFFVVAARGAVQVEEVLEPVIAH